MQLNEIRTTLKLFFASVCNRKKPTKCKDYCTAIAVVTSKEGAKVNLLN